MRCNADSEYIHSQVITWPCVWHTSSWPWAVQWMGALEQTVQSDIVKWQSFTGKNQLKQKQQAIIQFVGAKCCQPLTHSSIVQCFDLFVPPTRESIALYAHWRCHGVVWQWPHPCDLYCSGHAVHPALKGVGSLPWPSYKVTCMFGSWKRHCMAMYLGWRHQGHGGEIFPSAVQGVHCIRDPSVGASMVCLFQHPSILFLTTSVPFPRTIAAWVWFDHVLYIHITLGERVPPCSKAQTYWFHFWFTRFLINILRQPKHIW
jgi:hypothetical protein